jgi:hypothetical protein
MLLFRQGLDIFSVQANIRKKWSDKINKLFWRGRDSRQERLDLVLIGRKNPSLIDAALTNMFFYREKEHLNLYGPTVNYTSFFDFFDVKIAFILLF